MRRIISSDEAKIATVQHEKPCGDCPWTRKAVPGWLGSLSPDEWIEAAHGESTSECHTLLGAQCAGMAIYRANMCKLPRNQSALKLKADRENVFATPKEFLNHHKF
jgi:hypothetical protein